MLLEFTAEMRRVVKAPGITNLGYGATGKSRIGKVRLTALQTPLPNPIYHRLAGRLE